MFSILLFIGCSIGIIWGNYLVRVQLIIIVAVLIFILVLRNKQNSIPFEPPEIKSVKRYIKNHTTSHIPVDINVSDTLFTCENYMFNAFNQYAIYSEIEEDHKELIFQEGYSFLNSKKNEELVEKRSL